MASVGEIQQSKKNNDWYRVTAVDANGEVIKAVKVSAAEAAAASSPAAATAPGAKGSQAVGPAATPMSLSGMPSKEYESHIFDRALPAQHDEYPNTTAAIKLAGNIVEGARDAALMIPRMVRDNPATTVAAASPVGPVGSFLLAGAGQAVDKYVVPYARRAIEQGANAVADYAGGVLSMPSIKRATKEVFGPGDYEIIPPPLDKAALDIGMAAATAGLLPAGGGGLLPEAPTMTPVTLPGGRLRPDLKVPVKPWDPAESGWAGVPYKDIPADGDGLMSRGEIERIGTEGLKELSIPKVTPGQAGSKVGEYADNMLGSTVREGAENQRLELQRTTLDRQAAAAAGKNANDVGKLAQPVAEQAVKDREGLAAAAAAADQQATAHIEQATANVERAKADLQKVVDYASTPNVPPEEAGRQLKIATSDYVLGIKEEQNKVRNLAAAKFSSDDPNAVREAAMNTEDTLYKILRENNLVETMASGEEQLVATSSRPVKMDRRILSELRRMYDDYDIRNMKPSLLEDFRQEIGALWDKANDMRAHEPTSRTLGYSVSALGELYAKLKDVQMVMYSPKGQDLINQADDVFKKNIDVIEGLEPWLRGTDNQDVVRLLFGRGQLDKQVAAQKASAGAFKGVVEAKQAQLVQEAKGDVEGIQARVRAMGADTADFFNLRPITQEIETKLRAVGLAEEGAATAKADAAGWVEAQKTAAREYERRYGAIPGLRQNEDLTPSRVIEAFGSDDLGRVNALRELAEEAGKPELFDEMRAVWLYRQFSESKGYRDFERRIKNVGDSVRAAYFDGPGYVDLTNRFRTMAAVRERIMSSAANRSTGSKAQYNSAFFGYIWGPIVGTVLRKGAPFFDAISTAEARAAAAGAGRAIGRGTTELTLPTLVNGPGADPRYSAPATASAQ